jgi:ABC-type lipoprotein release transport system permease subunit
VTLLHIALRGIRHFRGAAFATAAGVAVAACVISGSFIAGDSVAATVRRVSLARLGAAHYAVVSTRPYSLKIAEALAANPGVDTAAAILLRSASAQNPDTNVTAALVQLVGADPLFGGLYPPERRFPVLKGRQAAISAALARDLGIREGDPFIVRVAVGQGESPASIFARRTLNRSVRPLRLECRTVLAADGPGGFGLSVETGERRNVIVDRQWLAEQLDASGTCDAILLRMRDDADLKALDAAVKGGLGVADLGLRVADHVEPYSLVVRGTGVTLGEQQLSALRDIRLPGVGRAEAGSMMLATRMRLLRAGPSAHYAVVGMTPDVRVPDGAIAVNEWLARDLKAVAGDELEVAWMEPASDGSYPERSVRLRVASIVPLGQSAAQGWAAPVFRGITDTRRISDWDPPFPVDLSRITARDEIYWQRYRAAPKAFVSEATIRRMWGSGEGDWVTAVRYRLPGHAPPVDSGDRSHGYAVDALERAIVGNARLQASGPRLRPIAAEALQAAQGSSDFRGLMIGMSLFIVISAIALAAMAMRLAAERRASQVGIMLAIGFTPRNAGTVLAIEGALAALAGSVVGAVLGVPFAAALVAALNSWWAGAVARQSIELAVGAAGPVMGMVPAFMLGTLAAWRASRGLSRAPVLRLLGGWRSMAAPRRRTAWRSPLRHASWAAPAIAGPALLILRPEDAAMALAAGALLLTAGLVLLAVNLAEPRRQGSAAAPLALRRIAERNAALRRGQSVLIAGVIAAASFLLVIVAANVRSGNAVPVRDRRSGAGGFDLIARSSVPLAVGFDTPRGRASLGFDPADEPVFQGMEVVPFLMSPGVDASCLNLAVPTAPRILGVLDDGRSGQGSAWKLFGNRFTVRTARASAGSATVVPAYADAESVRWILKSGLGRTIRRDTPAGTFVLRFDGLIASSIFAGEILVPEEHFRAMFPDVRAPAYFLISTRKGTERAVAEALRRNLGDAGLEVRTTQEVLDAVLTVQNTYLSAFLVLGGLGIALGVAGMGAVLLRAAYERRSELGIMAALGFTRRQIAAMMLAESAGLLVFGAALGTAAGLAATGSRIVSGEARVNWPALLAVIGFILVAGLGSCVLAAWRGTSGSTLEAIRSE